MSAALGGGQGTQLLTLSPALSAKMPRALAPPGGPARRWTESCQAWWHPQRGQTRGKEAGRSEPNQEGWEEQNLLRGQGGLRSGGGLRQGREEVKGWPCLHQPRVIRGWPDPEHGPWAPSAMGSKNWYPNSQGQSPRVKRPGKGTGTFQVRHTLAHQPLRHCQTRPCPHQAQKIGPGHAALS